MERGDIKLNGKERIDYIVKKGNSFSIWTNSKKASPDFDSISFPFRHFSRDGNKVIYKTSQGEKTSLWIKNELG